MVWVYFLLCSIHWNSLVEWFREKLRCIIFTCCFYCCSSNVLLPFYLWIHDWFPYITCYIFPICLHTIECNTFLSKIHFANECASKRACILFLFFRENNSNALKLLGKLHILPYLTLPSMLNWTMLSPFYRQQHWIPEDVSNFFNITYSRRVRIETKM